METNSKSQENTLSGKGKRRSTFAIFYYINRKRVRKDGLCQLLCRVSIDTECEEIGTKTGVNPKVWDVEAGRATGRSQNALEVNAAIDKLDRMITGHYDDIRGKLGFVTARLVKNAVLGIAQKPAHADETL
jgi:hypothetical protein